MEALKTVDAAFGEIVAAWKAAPDHDRRSIITVSDHGHVTTHERIDVVVHPQSIVHSLVE